MEDPIEPFRRPMSRSRTPFRPGGMNRTAKRLVAGALALTAAFVGLWAAADPHSFFQSFPFPGHHWVAAMPPYNEHLIRDVGGLYLALCVISAWAVARPRRATFAMVGLAWVVFSLPHLIFHAGHLDEFGTGDVVGNVVSLGGSLMLGLLLLVPARRLTGATGVSEKRLA